MSTPDQGAREPRRLGRERIGDRSEPLRPMAPQQVRTARSMAEVVTAQQAFPHWGEIRMAVREAFIARGLGDPSRGGADEASRIQALQALVGEMISQHPEWRVAPAQQQLLTAFVAEEFYGLGPIGPYMRIEGLEEVLCNRHDRVFVIVEGQKTRIEPSPFSSEEEVRDFLNRVFAWQGRELNLANPAEDGQLPDGSRIHAEIPPLAVLGSCFAIRKFRPMPFTMDDYLASGMFPQAFLDRLREWIDGELNIVISGSTGSGKTTLINAVGDLIPREDRLVIIENTKELQIETEDTLYIQSIMRGAREGRADERSITLRDGLRYALRLRPDRIILGEVRSVEAFDLLQALNTGHAGSFTTIHANSSVDAIARLEGLAAGADELPLGAIQDLIGRTVDVVIQVGRFRGTAARKVLEAWQVLHPQQVVEEGRAAYEEARSRGEVMEVRPNVEMLPLFTLDREGVLIERNRAIPVMGKAIGGQVWA